MLGKPMIIRERLARFVSPPEVSRITSLGTEKVIDTFLEGLAQVKAFSFLEIFKTVFFCVSFPFLLFQASTASICLLSKARHNSQLKRENENIRRDLSIAQKKITDFEADRGAFEAARERASRLETELSSASERSARAEGELLIVRERESRVEAALLQARERARRAEAELVEARERASLRETELVESRERASLREAELMQAHERASLREVAVKTELAEGIANAFIDGYEELRGKISAAFPDLDFSGFLPTEEPDDTDDYEEEEEDGEEGSSE